MGEHPDLASIRKAAQAVDLDELERLAKEASPLPWTVQYGYGGDAAMIVAGPGDTLDIAAMLDHDKGVNGDANADLIVGAVNAVPSLVARVRELEAAALTALGNLDDPTGGTHVEDMRRAAAALRAALPTPSGGSRDRDQ